MVGADVVGDGVWARMTAVIKVVNMGLAISELDSRILAENPLA